MLGFPLLYFKGMRILMFQLSGFYFTIPLTCPQAPGDGVWVPVLNGHASPCCSDHGPV